MRVLFLAGADQQGGGSYQMAKSILYNVPLYNREIEFIVLTQRRGPFNQWCDARGIENYCLPYRYCVFLRPKARCKAVLKRTLKLFLVTLRNYSALKALDKMKLLRTIDLIHTNMERDLLGMMISKRYRIPNVTHIRELLDAQFQLSFIYPRQINYMNQYTGSFVAVSETVMKYWVDHYGLEKEKIEVIYDGIQPELVRYTRKNSDTRRPLRLVMCGSIYAGKGQLELIQAVCAAVAEYRLDISVDFYGEAPASAAPYQQNLMDYIEERGLGRIFRFHGYCDHEVLLRQLTDYDVGVMCSTSEGFGLVTVEYMLAGLCVIASNTGANPELIRHGKTGFLYPLGDVKQLMERIVYVYHNRAVCETLGEAAHAFAAREFSMEHSAKKLVRLYNRLLGGNQIGNPSE